MAEYMLLIRNQKDHQASWSSARYSEFLKACQSYIGGLQAAGELIAAQPLVREGCLIAGTPDKWRLSSFQEGKEVIVGYYHIWAKDANDAIRIAKGNPEFSFSQTARVEVRPIKTGEEQTGFTYPVE